MMMTTGAVCDTGRCCVGVWLAFVWVWVRYTRPPAGDVVDLFPSSVLSHFSPLVTGKCAARCIRYIYIPRKDPKEMRESFLYLWKNASCWVAPSSLSLSLPQHRLIECITTKRGKKKENIMQQKPTAEGPPVNRSGSYVGCVKHLRVAIWLLRCNSPKSLSPTQLNAELIWLETISHAYLRGTRYICLKKIFLYIFRFFYGFDYYTRAGAGYSM